MLLALLVWVVAFGVVGFFFTSPLWFPPPINEHGRLYDSQFMVTLVVTGVIFFLAQVALGWVIFKYRSNGGRASYSHGNNKLEVFWTSAAAVIFIGSVLMSSRIWAGFHMTEPPANSVKIETLGKQFLFNFRYPGADGKFGKLDIKQASDANGNPFGIDEKDPNGSDDIVSSSIRVPVGKPVQLLLRSRDVIHNFFVRELRIKQDLVPGMEIPIHFQADVPGTYEIPCSELCGLGHQQMRSTLIVMQQAEYDAWLAEQDKALKGAQ